MERRQGNRGNNSMLSPKKGLIRVNPRATSILLGGKSRGRIIMGSLSSIDGLERQLEE